MYFYEADRGVELICKSNKIKTETTDRLFLFLKSIVTKYYLSNKSFLTSENFPAVNL